MTGGAPVPPAGPPCGVRERWQRRGVTAACVLALVGLALTAGHFLWPTPLMFALFVLVGQGAFGLAMAAYGAVIFSDLRRRRVL